MDGIGNKTESLNVTTPRVDHSARMQRVDTALQEQSVAVAQLTPQQTADFRAYAGTALDNINTVVGLGPREHIGVALGTGGFDLPDVPPGRTPEIPGIRIPLGPGGSDLPVIVDKPKTPEQREKELEEKIREKTDPEFAAKKKAERTASKLHTLLNPFHIPMGGFGGPLSPKDTADAQAKRVEADHQGDLEIIDVLYGLSAKEIGDVKKEYEKSFGKTLEEEIRRHFRGDVQQKLLALVTGGGDAKAGDAKAADAKAGEAKGGAAAAG